VCRYDNVIETETIAGDVVKDSRAVHAQALQKLPDRSFAVATEFQSLHSLSHLKEAHSAEHGRDGRHDGVDDRLPGEVAYVCEPLNGRKDNEDRREPEVRERFIVEYPL
jgi:hypothetical protein